VRFNELKKIDDKWCYYYKDTVEYYFLFTGQAEEKNRNGELGWLTVDFIKESAKFANQNFNDVF
jgi:replicative DNA helicase